MTGLVTYDQEADVLYVQLLDDPIAHTKFLDDLRGIDYSADNAVIGVEFINASEGVDLSDIPFAQKVEELIGQSGHQLPIFA